MRGHGADAGALEAYILKALESSLDVAVDQMEHKAEGLMTVQLLQLDLEAKKAGAEAIDFAALGNSLHGFGRFTSSSLIGCLGWGERREPGPC